MLLSRLTTTVYIFSGSKVIAEYQNGAAPSSPTTEYVYAGGALLAKINSSGTFYYHQDHLSNRIVTNSSGTVTAQMGHFPFGESWYNATADKLFFTTYERDSESGNDYAMARYHISRLGRLSSPDPLNGSTSNPQSLNRYAYSMNDPAEMTDPSGLCAVAQNQGDHPRDESGQSGGHEPSDETSDEASAEAQNAGQPCYGTPWWLSGGVTLDGGDITDNSGAEGMGFAVGGGDFGALVDAATTPTGFYIDQGTDFTACILAFECDDLGFTPFKTGLIYGNLGLLALAGGGGQSGSGGGNDKAKQVIKAALKEKNLSKCLHKFFGPGTILTNTNLPKINASENLAGAAIGETRASEVPDVGQATIYIDKGSFAGLSPTDPMLFDTYLHETANVLAIQRFTNIQPRRVRALMGPLGSPPSTAQISSFDPDIGQQFEDCVKGKQ